MKKTVIIFLVSLMLLTLVSCADYAMKNDVEELKVQVETMQKGVEEMKEELTKLKEIVAPEPKEGEVVEKKKETPKKKSPPIK